jgi:hypothetical protein
MLSKLRNNPVTIIISILILAVFTGYLFNRDSVFSESENRYLAARPKPTAVGLADGSFMEQFELYTEERLPLRDVLIRLKSAVEQLQLKNENNGIAVGRDGYLFEKLVAPGAQIEKNRAALVNFAEKCGRDINICIIPNSCEILKEKLPAGFPNIAQRDEISDLYTALKGMDNVSVTDMYDILSEHRNEYIYYRTDHHWTTQGAYYGYLKLCEDMGLDPVSPDMLSDKRKDVPGFLGTYYSKYRGFGIESDVLTYYDIAISEYETGGVSHEGLYDLDKLDTYDKYAMFMYGNEGLSIVRSSEEPNALRKKELILFKDSYSNCLIPFMTYNYDTITVIDLRYFNASVSELLRDHADADVLLLYNFMHYDEDNHFYRLVTDLK